jgi:hypothetical protein
MMFVMVKLNFDVYVDNEVEVLDQVWLVIEIEKNHYEIILKGNPVVSNLGQ